MELFEVRYHSVLIPMAAVLPRARQNETFRCIVGTIRNLAVYCWFYRIMMIFVSECPSFVGDMVCRAALCQQQKQTIPPSTHTHIQQLQHICHRGNKYLLHRHRHLLQQNQVRFNQAGRNSERSGFRSPDVLQKMQRSMVVKV